MEIGNVSMAMSQYSVQNSVGVSVMKLAMDSSKEMAGNMTKVMESGSVEAVDPNLGRIIDVSV